MDCPICLEIVTYNDICKTECGHVFHSKCMFRSIASGNLSCPCCRFELVKKPESFPIEIVERSLLQGSEILRVRPIQISRSRLIREIVDNREQNLLITNLETTMTRAEAVSESNNQSSIITFFRNFIP